MCAPSAFFGLESNVDIRTLLHCMPLIFRLVVTFLLESDKSQIISYSPFKGYLLATWYCYAGDVQRMSRKNFSGCLVGVDSARRWSPLGLWRLVVVIFFFLGVIFFLGGASASWWSSFFGFSGGSSFRWLPVGASGSGSSSDSWRGC